MRKRHLAVFIAAILTAISPSFAADPSIPAATPPRHVDLLKLLDLSKDVRSGSWNLDNGVLSTPKAKGAHIEFPYAPPAEYDYRVVFTTTGDKAQMSLLLAANHRQFGWMLGGWDGKIAGFHNIDGKNADKNPSTKKSTQWILPDREHTTLVKVRKDGVQALLDDHPIDYLQTDYSNLTLGPSYKMDAGDSVGIDVRFADMKISAVEIIEISGPGTALRGSLAAAVPPPPPAPVAAATIAPATAPAVAVAVAPSVAPTTASPAAPIASALKVPLDPTADDAKQLFDAGQYQDCQVAITRVIAGPPGFDRNQLLLLRAECLLQTKQLQLAMEVLDGISKSAAKVADTKTAAKAGALYFVLKLSPGGTYTPLTTDDKTPISLLNMPLRKMAYEAVFTDQMALCDKNMKDADNATTIAPILTISQTFLGLRYLERENTGATKRTDPIGKKLAALSIKIINRSLDDDKKIIEKASENAGHLVRVTSSYTLNSNGYSSNNARMVRQGLSHPEVVDLDDVDSACRRIVDTCGNFIFIFDAHADALRDTASRAGKIAERAETVLNGHDDPGGDVYVRIPKP